MFQERKHTQGGVRRAVTLGGRPASPARGRSGGASFSRPPRDGGSSFSRPSSHGGGGRFSRGGSGGSRFGGGKKRFGGESIDVSRCK